MRNNLIAQRYAKAVLKNVEHAKHGVLNEDIKGLQLIFTGNNDFARSLNSFLYPLKERLELTEKIAEKLNLKEVWGNLFRILIKKHRFNIISDIISRLEYYILAEHNKVKITLTLAFEHDEKMIDKIKKRVEEVLNCGIETTIVIDPSIIGGFVAETETMRVDGSIHNNLVKLVQSGSKRF